MYLRRNFSSSGLVRLLGDLDKPHDADGAFASQADAPGQDFAEKLSLWVGVFEAGTLHAAHQAVGAVTASESARALPGRDAARQQPLKEQLHQVRSILARGINTDHAPDAGARRGRRQFEAPAPAPGSEADFAPFRQRYQDQQRNMELMIGPLRDNVRQTLSAASPELRQLAALDAVWEQMLAGREQKLMSTVPVRLKRRFDSLRKANQPAADTSENPQLFPSGTEPGSQSGGGWLDVFGKELQQILLAELDVRLEAVTGLIEAFEFEQEGWKYP